MFWNRYSTEYNPVFTQLGNTGAHEIGKSEYSESEYNMTEANTEILKKDWYIVSYEKPKNPVTYICDGTVIKSVNQLTVSSVLPLLKILFMFEVSTITPKGRAHRTKTVKPG